MINLLPEENLHAQTSFNLAPMIDFLFLMLAVFATLAVTRATLFDTKLDLAHLKKETTSSLVHPKPSNFQVNISISPTGEYKWITEIHDYPMIDCQKIQKELIYQHKIGVFPKDKTQIQILLHIDKNAPWERIAKLLFAIREIGFEAHPIYESVKGTFQ